MVLKEFINKFRIVEVSTVWSLIKPWICTFFPDRGLCLKAQVDLDPIPTAINNYNGRESTQNMSLYQLGR